MEKRASILHTIRLFGKGIHILFETSVLYAVLVIVLNFISGLIAPLNSLFYQRLLDCIVDVVGAREWLSSGTFFLMILSMLGLISFILNGVIGYIKQIYSDKVDLYITEKVLSKAVLLPMETFDDAEIYNHINMAVTRTSSSCLNLLEAISEIIYSLVKGLSYLYIIVNFSWPVAVVSIV